MQGILKSTSSVAMAFGLTFIALPAAAADVLIFDSRATWLAGIGAISGSEDFEGFTAASSFVSRPLSLNNMILSGSTGANPLSDTQLVDVPPLSSLSGYSPNGTSYLLADLIPGNYTQINFMNPVRAWSADFTGISNNRVSHLIFKASGGTTVFDLAVPSTPTSDGQLVERFIGISSRIPIYSITMAFNGPGINDVFGVDSIAFATAVPELPKSTLLLAGCLALFGASFSRNSSRRGAVGGTARCSCS